MIIIQKALAQTMKMRPKWCNRHKRSEVRMPKLRARQVWLSLLVIALFAPIYLPTGSAAFRPAWLSHFAAGMPISVWMVLGLIVLYVALTWLFSRSAFGDDRTGGES
jgi:polyferredoxin